MDPSKVRFPGSPKYPSPPGKWWKYCLNHDMYSCDNLPKLDDKM